MKSKSSETLEEQIHYDEVMYRIEKIEEREKKRQQNLWFGFCLLMYLLGGVVLGVILDRIVLGMV